jgi:hypothetical protein
LLCTILRCIQKSSGLSYYRKLRAIRECHGRQLPKRGDYEYIKKKAEDVFYDPKVATKELIDEVYESVNDRIKLIKH